MRNQTNRSTQRYKIETKVYGRAERGKREPSGTTAPWWLKNKYFYYD